MKSRNVLAVTVLAALACGCDARTGPSDDNGAINARGPAEGKAEEGVVALDAPGLSFKIKLPLDRAGTDGKSKLLYPGSYLTGIYIAARSDSKTGAGGEAELRFASSDPPDTVAAWYRNQHRLQAVVLSSDDRDGAALVLLGTEKVSGDGFKVRLEPKAVGTVGADGTDGRLTVHDRH
jgi:hypothetical protein